MHWVSSFAILCTVLIAIYVQYNLLPTQIRPLALRWGQRADSDTIRPFKVSMPREDEAGFLKERLSRLPEGRHQVLESASDDYGWGINRTWFKEAMSYWRDTYRWSEAVERMNRIPQYTTDILGLRIHFWHIPAPDPAAPVVLLIHGWPGSVWEFHRVVQRLLGRYHIVVPSLPGFGWSEAASVPGLCPVEIGHIFTVLMKRLNYKKYIIQGGDWGSLVAQSISRLAPEAVHGMVLNFYPVVGLRLATGLSNMLWASSDDWERLSKTLGAAFELSGYFHQQATKPHTLGMALSDSPLGLSAWILEKFATWSDTREGLLSPSEVIPMEDLLTNVMIYWSTGTATSSIRIYKEFLNSKASWDVLQDSTPVRTTILDFPKEPCFPLPKEVVGWKFTNLVRFVKAPAGGHFAALEQPEFLTHELESFITTEENRRAEVDGFLKDWIQKEKQQEAALKADQMEQTLQGIEAKKLARKAVNAGPALIPQE